MPKTRILPSFISEFSVLWVACCCFPVCRKVYAYPRAVMSENALARKLQPGRIGECRRRRLSANGVLEMLAGDILSLGHL
jgi:hypothetical protein